MADVRTTAGVSHDGNLKHAQKRKHQPNNYITVNKRQNYNLQANPCIQNHQNIFGRNLRRHENFSRPGQDSFRFSRLPSHNSTYNRTNDSRHLMPQTNNFVVRGKFEPHCNLIRPHGPVQGSHAHFHENKNWPKLVCPPPPSCADVSVRRHPQPLADTPDVSKYRPLPPPPPNTRPVWCDITGYMRYASCTDTDSYDSHVTCHTSSVTEMYESTGYADTTGAHTEDSGYIQSSNSGSIHNSNNGYINSSKGGSIHNSNNGYINMFIKSESNDVSTCYQTGITSKISKKALHQSSSKSPTESSTSST